MADKPVLKGRERKLQILYIQPGTRAFAGMERVIDTICSKLSELHGDDLSIDVLYTTIHHNRPTDPRPYRVIDAIARNRFDLMRQFRRVIASKEYDLIVVPQVEPAVICMASCLGLKRKFAVHLHGNPELERSHTKAKLLFFLMKAVFLKRLSSVFGTSPRQLESFRAMFKSSLPHYWVPNPVRHFAASAMQADRDARDVITFVNVGRFSFQKGQDVLLAAFDKLRMSRGNVRLKIVGYGSGEAALRKSIQELGLADLVSIEHHPEDPSPALASSDIYVSSSRWEGWSLAICEALRFGLPVVSTNCEFGPSDILVDNRLGRLVPMNGIDGLLEAMNYYCDNLVQERSHAQYRRDYVDQFSPERVVSQHANAIRYASGFDRALPT
ncbi:glycosyltransferase [Neorhizobium sp. DAR64861/K0K2]|uniref:glycosyltransferase n=1 Tax=unclassified Neorhizobium TaxID=2629175 RepID=UPI003D276BD7